jgi:uncharacterized protein YdaU (DUF1376 family)
MSNPAPIPRWIKFSFPDLRSSVRFKRMTLEERGLYLTLLCEQATGAELPSDDESLGVVVASSGINISERAFQDAWSAAVQSCFEENGGLLSNPRMAEEIAIWEGKSVDLSEKRAAAGRVGGLKSGEARRSNSKQTEARPSKPKQTEARVEESRGEKSRDSTPLTPLPGGNAFDLGGEWSEALSALAAVAPGSRFARGLPVTAVALANDWKSTGKGAELLRRSTERYRRLDGEGRRAPTLEDLERHSTEVLREVMATVPNWTRAVEMARTGAPGYKESLEGMGADFSQNEREWCPTLASKWKRCRAMELIEIESLERLGGAPE